MKRSVAVLALLLTGALLRSAPPGQPDPKRLDDVARIGSVMVDGDVCRRIVTARAMQFMLKKDARDPWIGSDNFDVNHEPYISTKKTLIRLSRLVDFPCDVNLWMPVPAKPPRIQILIRNVNEMSQFWTWGALHQELPPEMKKVLETGERVTVTKRPGMISVLAPVYDSLGDVVGLIEAVGQTQSDPQANVK
jgi:hypothetical protein